VGENGIFGFSATAFVYCRNLRLCTYCTPNNVRLSDHKIIVQTLRVIDYQYFSFTRYIIVYLANFHVLRQKIIFGDDCALFVLTFNIQSQLIVVH